MNKDVWHHVFYYLGDDDLVRVGRLPMFCQFTPMREMQKRCKVESFASLTRIGGPEFKRLINHSYEYDSKNLREWLIYCARTNPMYTRLLASKAVNRDPGILQRLPLLKTTPATILTNLRPDRPKSLKILAYLCQRDAPLDKKIKKILQQLLENIGHAKGSELYQLFESLFEYVKGYVLSDNVNMVKHILRFLLDGSEPAFQNNYNIAYELMLGYILYLLAIYAHPLIKNAISPEYHGLMEKIMEQQEVPANDAFYMTFGAFLRYNKKWNTPVVIYVYRVFCKLPATTLDSYLHIICDRAVKLQDAHLAGFIVSFSRDHNEKMDLILLLEMMRKNSALSRLYEHEHVQKAFNILREVRPDNSQAPNQKLDVLTLAYIIRENIYHPWILAPADANTKFDMNAMFINGLLGDIGRKVPDIIEILIKIAIEFDNISFLHFMSIIPKFFPMVMEELARANRSDLLIRFSPAFVVLSFGSEYARIIEKYHLLDLLPCMNIPEIKSNPAIKWENAYIKTEFAHVSALRP